MTTPTTPPRGPCPTPGCILGRLHTGLCRNRAGSALVAANASPGAFLREVINQAGPVTGGYLRSVDVTVDGLPACRRSRAGQPCPDDPYTYPPGRVPLTSDCGHVRVGVFCAIEHAKIAEREQAELDRTAAMLAPAPAPADDEIVPYTPAQQAADLRKALETPCTCGQPGGHALGCPRRPLQLHAEIAASIERGEIDAPATLGTEVDGLLYYWQGALLGWTVLRTGTLAELFPGGLTLAHRCGTEIALPDVFRLPDLVAAAVAHFRECGR